MAGRGSAVVGESGSGKTTLLNCLSTRLAPTSGEVTYRMRDGVWRDLYRMSEAERRFLMRTDWGFVHQNPGDGLRMTVSAGANVGERLMAIGERNYGAIRDTALDWLGRVEIAADRIDDEPRAFSGGMRQRLQIARNLVTGRAWSSWTSRRAASTFRCRRACSTSCAGSSTTSVSPPSSSRTIWPWHASSRTG